MVAVNRKYQYVKVYKVLKRVNESTNRLSEFTAKLIDRFMQKGKGTGRT